MIWNMLLRLRRKQGDKTADTAAFNLVNLKVQKLRRRSIFDNVESRESVVVNLNP